MDTRTAVLFEKYKDILDIRKSELKNPDYAVFENQLSLLERIAEVENSSLTIMDLYQQKYIFMRSKFSGVIGYELNQALENGYDYFFKKMHPQDLPVVLDTCIQSFEFLAQAPAEERRDYKTIFDYRLKTKTGSYIRMIQQIVVLELDNDGHIWLVLILNDLLPDKSNEAVTQRRLINMKTGKLYLFHEEEDENTKTLLSRREIEILGLLSKGMASKDIADQLFISVNTVNNHRQNILKKVDAGNTAEAVMYARMVGVI